MLSIKYNFDKTLLDVPKDILLNFLMGKRRICCRISLFNMRRSFTEIASQQAPVAYAGFSKGRGGQVRSQGLEKREKTEKNSKLVKVKSKEKKGLHSDSVRFSAQIFSPSSKGGGWLNFAYCSEIIILYW